MSQVYFINKANFTVFVENKKGESFALPPKSKSARYNEEDFDLTKISKNIQINR